MLTSDYVNSNFFYEDRLEPENEALQEDSFSIDEFNNGKRWKDNFSIAFKVKNLILMEKGTNPAAIDMGVGLRNYLFELLTDETIDEIREEITNQIKDYIPNNRLKEVLVESGNDRLTLGKNSLFILLKFGELQKEDPEVIALKFENDIYDKSKLVSQILF